MTPDQFFAQKTAVPSEMTTVQWDRVRLEIRERSFFMAAVTQAEVLQTYQTTTAKYVAGEISEAEARRELREGLAKVGYLPRPGEEGGIKDLRTGRRMDVVLRTNASMAANKAAYDKQLLAIKVFPAKRMVRMTPKRIPRNWHARWRDYKGQPGVNAKEMAALVTSPVWVQLSRFGAPYPPYDFGSGMGDLAVRRDEAQRLGLLDGPPAKPAPAGGPRIEDGEAVVSPSFNEALEVRPEVTHPAIRQQLTDDLQGLARWEGDTLIFTDPNGTRPVPSYDLAKTIGTPNRAGVDLLQADTLRTWAAEGPARFTKGSNALYHFRRLVRRVIPLGGEEPLTLTRGYPTQEARDRALASLTEGQGWTPRAAPFPFTAFSRAGGTLPEGYTLTLRVTRHATAKDLTPAVEEMADEDAHGHHALFERGATFRVVSRHGGEGTHAVVILTEEVQP